MQKCIEKIAEPSSSQRLVHSLTSTSEIPGSSSSKTSSCFYVPVPVGREGKSTSKKGHPNAFWAKFLLHTKTKEIVPWKDHYSLSDLPRGTQKTIIIHRNPEGRTLAFQIW